MNKRMPENNLSLEKEVKIFPIDLEKFESKLLSLGAECIGVEMQRNWLFDVPQWEREGSYLRLRELLDEEGNVASAELTWKENRPGQALRVNRETNVPLSHPVGMRDILTALGYPVIECAHKERKSYLFRKARIELDRWDPEDFPFPYAEIEVESEKQLEEILDMLEISKDRVSTLSIRELKLKWLEGSDEIHA